MTLDFSLLRRLISTSINQVLNINRELKDLKHDIREELKEIKKCKKHKKNKKLNSKFGRHYRSSSELFKHTNDI